MGLIKEYVLFLKREKKWWLIPLVILLFILGAVISFFEGSTLAQFIYPLF